MDVKNVAYTIIKKDKIKARYKRIAVKWRKQMNLYKVTKRGFTEDVALFVLAYSEIAAKIEVSKYENCSMNDIIDVIDIKIDAPVIIARKTGEEAKGNVLK